MKEKVKEKVKVKKSGAAAQKIKAVTKSPRGKKSKAVSQAINTSNREDRYQIIAAAAYYRAEKRGFKGGDVLQDWLEAEKKVDSSRQI